MQTEALARMERMPPDQRLFNIRHNETPCSPPVFSDKESWLKRVEALRRQLLVAAGLWPLPEKSRCALGLAVVPSMTVTVWRKSVLRVSQVFSSRETCTVLSLRPMCEERPSSIHTATGKTAVCITTSGDPCRPGVSCLPVSAT